MSRCTILLTFGVLSFAVFSAHGQDQDTAPAALQPPPQPVMVINANAELKAGNDVISKAALGDILVGREVNGTWLWIPNSKGWIRQADVVPIDKAIDHFTTQIEQSPTTQHYTQRAVAQASLGQLDKAVEDFSQAIKLDPQNVSAFNDRGTTYRQMGQLEKAKVDFDSVIAKGVRHPAVYTNRGQVWLDLGNVEQAMVDLHIALDLDERYAPAWEASGAAREVMGHIAKAIDDYRVAVDIDPNFALAWNNRAWLLATTPDSSLRNGRQAVAFATKACELTGFQKADILDTLAAAHAEAGQFEQAIRRAKEALAKADEHHKPSIEKHLALFEAGKPYRQQPK